jgi:hypothetical protein
MPLSRRQFQQLAGTTLVTGMNSVWLQDAAGAGDELTGPLETFVPTRAITRGPANHWFGYYDKREFDPTGRYVLANETTFEGRPPTGKDSINVGYVDTEQGDKWCPIGTSRAWGWQQGCMLQWVGEKGDHILWNDRQGDRFVCRVRSMSDDKVRTLSRPIYTVSSDGTFGLSVDFRRIDNLRPGYGYDGLADPHVSEHAPSESGIWRVDLETGEDQLIMSLADVAAIAWPDGNRYPEAWHYFNHLLINPSGNRFTVLHRYRPAFDPITLSFKGIANHGFVTRMITANLDGSECYVLDPSGHTSHFIWKNDEEVTMWTRPKGSVSGFYTLKDRSREVVPVGHEKMPTNGHNTYLPAPYGDWILNDTYPDRKTSRQTVFLFHVPSGQRFDLGHFPSPAAYRGEWRCDTHPRFSDDGTTVAIDSPHDGGRQIYLMDVRNVLNSI